MPAAWLLQLLGQVACREEGQGWPAGRPGVLALFRLCTALRDLVLAQRTLLLGFCLPIAPDQQAAAQGKLVRACRSSAKVHLRLNSTRNGYGHLRADSASIAEASSLMLGAMEALGHGLESITSVALKDLELNAVAPSWLALTCPNMTSLEHKQCGFNTLPAPPASTSPCGQLSRCSVAFRGHEAADLSFLAWQHQLQSLTGLQSLEVNNWARTLPAWFLECCASAVGPHLTSLSWDLNVPSLTIARLPAWYPCLRELQLDFTFVEDQGMEVLLSMQLQRFSCCRLELQHSHTHHPCTWQQLSVKHLDISAFDRLPLEGVQVMAGGQNGSITIHPSPGDLGAASRLAAVLARSGVMTARGLELSNHSVHATVPSVAAAMAVVACWQGPHVQLGHIQLITPELLAAIKQHLPSTKATRLKFESCTFHPDVLPLLLPSLPPAIQEVTLRSWDATTEVTEAQVTIVCTHACRPIKVAVTRRSGPSWWEAGWEERVQAAMAAVGHMHIELSVKMEW